jgi:hypothetical protein
VRAQIKRAHVGWFTVAPHPYVDDFRRGMRELGWLFGSTYSVGRVRAALFNAAVNWAPISLD